MRFPESRIEYETAAPRQSRSGLGSLVVAVISALTCLALLVDAQDDYWRLGGAAAFGLLTWFLAKKGKRRRIPVLHSIDALVNLANRTEIPIAIYLRRFDDDQGIEHPPAAESDDHDSDEAQLAESFNRHCLFVAVGRPGERLPPWGAYRLYLEDDEWEEKVSQLISIAALIIVKWADTEPVKKEIGLIEEASKLKRTIFLLPSHESVESLHQNLPTEALVEFETPEQPNNQQYAAFFTLAEAGGKVHYRDRKLSYGEAARKVVVERFDMEELTKSQLNVMRGFYGTFENLASRALIISLYTFVGSAVVGFLLFFQCL